VRRIGSGRVDDTAITLRFALDHDEGFMVGGEAGVATGLVVSV